MGTFQHQVAKRTGLGHAERDRTAERVTLGISLLILGTIVGGLIWLEATRGNAAARISIRPDFGAVYEHDDAYYLPFTVRNTGDQTTDELRINLRREVQGGSPEEVDLTYTFLAGGEEVEGTAVFDARPTEDTVSVDVVGMTDP